MPRRWYGLIDFPPHILLYIINNHTNIHLDAFELLLNTNINGHIYINNLINICAINIHNKKLLNIYLLVYILYIKNA